MADKPEIWKIRIVTNRGQLMLEMPNVKQEAKGIFDPKLLDRATVYLDGSKWANCREVEPVKCPQEAE